MTPLPCAAKFDPFLSLDCAPTPSTMEQSKERKGENFAIWQPCPVLSAPGKRLDKDEGVAAVDDLVLELDDGEGAPLSLLPAAADDPLLHLLYQNPEIGGIIPLVNHLMRYVDARDIGCAKMFHQ